MSDRERLAKLMGYEDSAWDLALRAADRLLAAGVTLPPAPERLVTTEMLDAIGAPMGGGPYAPPRYWWLTLDQANALVESALDRWIALHSDGAGQVRWTGSVRGRRMEDGADLRSLFRLKGAV